MSNEWGNHGWNVFGVVDNGERLPFPSVEFEGFAKESSLRCQPELTKFKSLVARYPWSDSTDPTLLTLEYDFISGKALPPAGIIGANPRLLSYPDVRVPLFTFTHERAHVQVGHEFRKPIEINSAEIHNFFHDTIIPDWLQGRVTFDYDKDYITDKSWDGLYGGNWMGPSDIKLDPALATIDNYFTLLRKGKIQELKMQRGSMLVHESPLFESWPDLAQSPDRDVREMYDEDRLGFTRKLLTGYMLVDYLQSSYRNTVSREFGIELWEFEEGFANFIASDLVEIPLDIVNQVTSQDEGKIEIAKRISGRGISAKEVLPRVRSYRELAEFGKNTFR